MTEQQLKPCNKNPKNPDSRKGLTASPDSVSKKHPRKPRNPNRFIASEGKSADFGSPSLFCKNPACRKFQSIDDTFCERCSCCICHQFDENKDPSLWLVCEPTPGNKDGCKRSCHIECAFKKAKVGVVNLGQYMALDGNYCCAFCGKIQEILRVWKKQLVIAKDARRVDLLCYRILLSYRLLEGTSRFKHFHEIVTEAKAKLEVEVGPLDGEPIGMARGIVSRLAVVGDVQKLCSLAIDKADEWLANLSSRSPNSAVDSPPATCKLLFEKITSSSLDIVVVELPTPFFNQIKEYKLWCSLSENENFPEEPLSIFPRKIHRVLMTNLQSCTEYTFRVVPCTEAGVDLGCSEAKCFTKSGEIVDENPSLAVPVKGNVCVEGSSSGAKEQPNSTPVGNSGFRVREFGKILCLAMAQQRGSLEDLCSAEKEQCCGETKGEDPKDRQSPPVSRELDLNVATVPDLNEDFSPPIESSRDEDNGCSLEKANGPDDDAASNGIEKNGLAGSNGCGPSDNSQAGNLTPIGDVPAVDSAVKTRRKRTSSPNEEAHEADSGLVIGSPVNVSGELGSAEGSFEYSVKVIRRLERERFISHEFRCKLLTWFSLKCTEQERRIVNTFIETLADEPKSLAGQLVDSFADIVLSKKAKSSLTSPP